MERVFHDAVLCAFRRDGADLVLTIENVVLVDTDVELGLENGLLVVRDISSVLEEDVTVTVPTVPCADGSILDLKIDTTSVRMLVEWRTYQPSTSKVMKYLLEGRAVEWKPTSPRFSRSEVGEFSVQRS